MSKVWISERWTSDQLNTFTTYSSSLLGVIAIVFSNHTQKCGKICCKSVQSFRNDLLQNPYFSATTLELPNRWIKPKQTFVRTTIRIWGFSIYCTLKIPTSQLSNNESTTRNISDQFHFSSQKNVDLVGEVSRAPQGRGKVWKIGGWGGTVCWSSVLHGHQDVTVKLNLSSLL